MKDQQLTFTRFLACFIVVVSHFGFEGETIIFPLNYIPHHEVFHYGGLAVLYFFMLSGYVLYVSNKKKFTSYAFPKISTFWLLRIARIYPVYLLSFIVMAVLGTRRYGDINLSTIEWLSNFTLTNSWYDGKIITEPKMINGTSWSLSVELIFYLLCPFLFYLIDHRVFRVFFLLSPFFFYFVERPLTREYNWYLLLMYHVFFIFGLLVAHYKPAFEAFLSRIKYKKLFQYAFTIVVYSALLILTMKFKVSSWYRTIYIVPVFALMILGVASFRSLLLDLYNTWICRKLGEISYTIFLFQLPVYLYLYARYFHEDSLNVKFWKTFVILLVLSYFINLLFEEPVRNWVKNRLVGPEKGGRKKEEALSSKL